MAVIWGLDLKEIQWWKFKSSYMFGNTDFHLRRTKFIIYQCAMILLVVSESLGTAVLSDYLDQQDRLQKNFPGIHVYNNDYIGIASYNIFVGVFAATVFGAAFFFDLFWPDRYEPPWVQWMWQGGAIFVCVAGLGDALAYTIILALHSQKITHFNRNNPALRAELHKEATKTPISYKHSGRAVASVVFLWLGWVSAVASTFVMIYYYRWYRHYGAKSTHAQNATKNRSFASAPSEEPIQEKTTTPAATDPTTNTSAARPAERPDLVPRVSQGGRLGHYVIDNHTSSVQQQE